MPSNKCSIVIPTKNALKVLPRVLYKVLHQNTPWNYEIVVIDSGSTDGTKEFVRQFTNIKLVDINPQSFGHGKTRNLGVEVADAEFVAFLTHDAEPIDENWLAELVKPAEQDEKVAGVFGRHVAYATASPFTKSDLDSHFSGFLHHPLVVNKETDPDKYRTDLGWRQFLHFYSDNNSLMRKSVWQEIPYPDVEFAEDQLWARSIIEAGYSKAYAPNSVVIHSHDYSFVEQLRRAFDESRNFNEYFGYKLSSDIRDTFRAMKGFTAEAFRQEIDYHYGEISTKHRFERALQRIALVAGHFLGSNTARIPRFVQQRLSLDNRLYRS